MFAENLKTQLARAGLTAYGLAKRAGVDHQLVYRTLKGTMPHADTAVRLARALGCTVEQLVQLEEARRKPGPA